MKVQVRTFKPSILLALSLTMLIIPILTRITSGATKAEEQGGFIIEVEAEIKGEFSKVYMTAVFNNKIMAEAENITVKKLEGNKYVIRGKIPSITTLNSYITKLSELAHRVGRKIEEKLIPKLTPQNMIAVLTLTFKHRPYRKVTILHQDKVKVRINGKEALITLCKCEGYSDILYIDIEKLVRRKVVIEGRTEILIDGFGAGNPQKMFVLTESGILEAYLKAAMLGDYEVYEVRATGRHIVKAFYILSTAGYVWTQHIYIKILKPSTILEIKGEDFEESAEYSLAPSYTVYYIIPIMEETELRYSLYKNIALFSVESPGFEVNLRQVFVDKKTSTMFIIGDLESYFLASTLLILRPKGYRSVQLFLPFFSGINMLLLPDGRIIIGDFSRLIWINPKRNYRVELCIVSPGSHLKLLPDGKILAYSSEGLVITDDRGNILARFDPAFKNARGTFSYVHISKVLLYNETDIVIVGNSWNILANNSQGDGIIMCLNPYTMKIRWCIVIDFDVCSESHFTITDAILKGKLLYICGCQYIIDGGGREGYLACISLERNRPYVKWCVIPSELGYQILPHKIFYTKGKLIVVGRKQKPYSMTEGVVIIYINATSPKIIGAYTTPPRRIKLIDARLEANNTLLLLIKDRSLNLGLENPSLVTVCLPLKALESKKIRTAYIEFTNVRSRVIMEKIKPIFYLLSPTRCKIIKRKPSRGKCIAGILTFKAVEVNMTRYVHLLTPFHNETIPIIKGLEYVCDVEELGFKLKSINGTDVCAYEITPNEYYLFRYWLINGSIKSYNPVIRFTVNGSTELKLVTCKIVKVVVDIPGLRVQRELWFRTGRITLGLEEFGFKRVIVGGKRLWAIPRKTYIIAFAGWLLPNGSICNKPHLTFNLRRPTNITIKTVNYYPIKVYYEVYRQDGTLEKKEDILDKWVKENETVTIDLRSLGYEKLKSEHWGRRESLLYYVKLAKVEGAEPLGNGTVVFVVNKPCEVRIIAIKTLDKRRILLLTTLTLILTILILVLSGYLKAKKKGRIS